MGYAEDRLEKMGLVLPELKAPIANFLTYKRVGNMLYLSGQGPKGADGKPIKGRLGKDRTLEEGYEDARKVGLQILAAAKMALGSLDGIGSVVKLLGLVNAEADFTDCPKVINGCSDLLVEVLGEKGKHTRSAFGVNSLPAGTSCEIEAIIEITEGY